MATFGSVDVAVKFLADASSVSKEAGKIEGTGNKIKSAAKGIGLAIGGAFAVDTVVGWVGAAEEANRASETLAQTLANAGDSTGAWAKHAEDLASSLMDQTGIDDEVIKGGQAILATFHDVGQTAGQTGGAFDRASKAALDMSKAGFGSVDSASTMLGKALQDPEKGLTALGKAGVTFSDDQKAAIKAMVESGDKAGAMNEILKNVEGQVGGVAEKSATAGDKMKTAFGETQESLGQALLPAMESLAPILEKVAGFIQQNASWLVPLAAAVAGVTIAVWLFNAALAANPIVLITIAIAALIAGIILLWNNWDTVWGWICDAMAWAVEWIKSAFQSVADFFASVWDWIKSVFQSAWDFIVNIWNQVAGFFGKIPGWIRDAFVTVFEILTWPYRTAWDFVVNVWNGAMDFFRKIPGWIGDAFRGLFDIIKGPFQAAWDWIKQWVVDPIKTAFDGVKETLRTVFNGIADLWNNTIGRLSFHVPDWVPGIGGKGFDVPDIPHMAAGGIVTRPTVALLGEAGPEAVVPLNRARGGITINITTTGLGADAPSIQSAVVAALTGHTNRNGPLPASIVGR